jgi:hypothetical protein
MVPSLPEGPLSQSLNWTENRPAGHSKAGHWTADGPTRMRDPRAKTIGAYLRILSYVRPDALILIWFYVVRRLKTKSQ